MSNIPADGGAWWLETAYTSSPDTNAYPSPPRSPDIWLADLRTDPEFEDNGKQKYPSRAPSPDVFVVDMRTLQTSADEKTMLQSRSAGNAEGARPRRSDFEFRTKRSGRAATPSSSLNCNLSRAYAFLQQGRPKPINSDPAVARPSSSLRQFYDERTGQCGDNTSPQLYELPSVEDNAPQKALSFSSQVLSAKDVLSSSQGGGDVGHSKHPYTNDVIHVYPAAIEPDVFHCRPVYVWSPSRPLATSESVCAATKTLKELEGRDIEIYDPCHDDGSGFESGEFERLVYRFDSVEVSEENYLPATGFTEVNLLEPVHDNLLTHTPSPEHDLSRIVRSTADIWPSFPLPSPYNARTNYPSVHPRWFGERRCVGCELEGGELK